MYKYKNESDYTQVVIGVGVVEAGAEIDSLTVIENPNFKYIGKSDNAPAEQKAEIKTSEEKN